MGSLFSRNRGSDSRSSQPSRVTEQDKAVLVSISSLFRLCTLFVSNFAKELKVQRDKLKKYQKKVSQALQLN